MKDLEKRLEHYNLKAERVNLSNISSISLFFEGSVLLTIYIIYIIINYILISYISYRGDVVGLHTLRFLTDRTDI